MYMQALLVQAIAQRAHSTWNLKHVDGMRCQSDAEKARSDDWTFVSLCDLSYAASGHLNLS